MIFCRYYLNNEFIKSLKIHFKAAETDSKHILEKKKGKKFEHHIAHIQKH